MKTLKRSRSSAELQSRIDDLLRVGFTRQEIMHALAASPWRADREHELPLVQAITWILVERKRMSITTAKPTVAHAARLVFKDIKGSPRQYPWVLRRFTKSETLVTYHDAAKRRALRDEAFRRRLQRLKQECETAESVSRYWREAHGWFFDPADYPPPQFVPLRIYPPVTPTAPAIAAPAAAGETGGGRTASERSLERLRRMREKQGTK